MKTTVKTMVLCMLGMVLLGGSAMAGYNGKVWGMKVYIGPSGSAYYDSSDKTLTVVPTSDMCTIRITQTTLGTQTWGPYCDVFIDATSRIVKSITMTGSKKTSFWTTGQTYDCRSFSSTYTHIGGTDYYGDDYGLGMSSAELSGWAYPTLIKLKYAVCWGTMPSDKFTFSRKDAGKAAEVDAVLPAAGRQMLFGR